MIVKTCQILLEDSSYNYQHIDNFELQIHQDLLIFLQSIYIDISCLEMIKNIYTVKEELAGSDGYWEHLCKFSRW